MIESKFILGDCMDPETGLPAYPDNYFDLAIVDPPYGINQFAHKANSRNKAAKRGQYGNPKWDSSIPDYEYFLELQRVSKDQIVWGNNYFGLKGGALVWDKNGSWFSDGEIAYCSKITGVRFCRFTWNGMIQQDMANKEHRIHPTQKPVALYRWLLENYAKPGDLILDTHVGSASSLIACESMGFNYVGYEIDPEYYEAAKKRMEKGIQLVMI